MKSAVVMFGCRHCGHVVTLPASAFMDVRGMACGVCGSGDFLVTRKFPHECAFCGKPPVILDSGSLFCAECYEQATGERPA